MTDNEQTLKDIVEGKNNNWDDIQRLAKFFLNEAGGCKCKITSLKNKLREYANNKNL